MRTRMTYVEKAAMTTKALNPDREPLFLRDGTSIATVSLRNIDRDSKRAIRATNCGRCGGSGVVLPWGTCFACGGRKVFTKTVRLYTKGEVEKIQAAKDRKAKRKADAREEERKANLAAVRANVEGFDLARMKGQMMVSGQFKTRIRSPRQEKDLATLADMLGSNWWTKPKALFLVSLVDQINEREKKLEQSADTDEALRADPANWVRAGRYEVSGEILAVKAYASDWGENHKMLVRDDAGRKFWCSVPNSLLQDADRHEDGAPMLRGLRVTLTATWETTSDKIFAKGKRPAKATLVSS